MVVVWTGLVAGTFHVVTGPDHIAALAPIAASRPKRATALGFVWGLGHATGVLFLGVLGVLMRGRLDLDFVGAWSEFIVGLTLILMAFWSFRLATRITIHSHGHHHAEGGRVEHAHPHVHIGNETHNEQSHERHQHAAFGIGILHGTAGAGHLFGVLPSLALPTEQAWLYLGAYVASAVGAMTLVGMGLGRFAFARSMSFTRRTMMTCGWAALLVGGYWISRTAPLL